MVILTLQRFGLRSMPDSRTVTNCFTLPARFRRILRIAGFCEAGEVLRPLTHRIIVLHEPEADRPRRYRHEPKTGDHCCYRGFCVGRFDIVASAGSAALRRCGSWAWATEEENASHRMNPAHFVAFYVVCLEHKPQPLNFVGGL